MSLLRKRFYEDLQGIDHASESLMAVVQSEEASLAQLDVQDAQGRLQCLLEGRRNEPSGNTEERLAIDKVCFEINSQSIRNDRKLMPLLGEPCVPSGWNEKAALAISLAFHENALSDASAFCKEANSAAKFEFPKDLSALSSSDLADDLIAQSMLESESSSDAFHFDVRLIAEERTAAAANSVIDYSRLQLPSAVEDGAGGGARAASSVAPQQAVVRAPAAAPRALESSRMNVDQNGNRTAIVSGRPVYYGRSKSSSAEKKMDNASNGLPQHSEETFQKRRSPRLNAKVRSNGSMNIEQEPEPSAAAAAAAAAADTEQPFKSARDVYNAMGNRKLGGGGGGGGNVSTAKERNNTTGGRGRRLGGKRKYQAPFRPDESLGLKRKPSNDKRGGNEDAAVYDNPLVEALVQDERCKNVEPVMIERICNEILSQNVSTRWDDIAGLDFAKNCVQEIVIWPLLKPELFGGLREPPRGLLLFGPPGTGKTLIGKAIATEAESTASTLTSKWVGEGEKMVRALFAVARCLTPAVVFVDEIDSLLTQRSEGDQEASRRIKTEFLVQMEGAGQGKELLLVVGATNRPQELDEAVRRRMTKRLYIPLPNEEARIALISHLLLKEETHSVQPEDIVAIAKKTRGYSGSDLTALCKEAAMGPIRDIMSKGGIASANKSDVRALNKDDFLDALKTVRSSVAQKELIHYKEWNSEFGTWQEAVTEELLEK